MVHVPVLKKEVIEALSPRENDVVVDGTVGRGGHASELYRFLGPEGIFIGIDLDLESIEATRPLLKGDSPMHLVNGNFRDIKKHISSITDRKVSAMLFDLGWNREQLNSSKGFTFQIEQPLYMTYGNPETAPLTAYEIVNQWREDEIADVLYQYGEERLSRRVAKLIIEERKKKPIYTTTHLVETILRAFPKSQQKGIHPATKTFQALRIAVNDEINSLKKLLEDIPPLLEKGARIGIISFHSIEDRIVKQSFRQWQKDGMGIASKAPISASPEEIAENPASRSAKLRTFITNI